MIAQSQKFFAVALLLTSPVAHADEHATLVDWQANSTPTGELVRLDLLGPPEIRGHATADEETGVMKFNGGSMVIDLPDEKKFRHLLTKNNELTIEVDVIPSSSQQHGPARIASYSSDHASRNFTIGQNGNQFDLRLLTDGSDANGVIPDGTFGKIEAGKKYHIAISYRPGRLTAAVNGKILLERHDIKGSLKNWTAHRLVFGDEINGDRAWHGEINGFALHNRAKNLRAKASRKRTGESDPNKEMIELKRRLEQLCAEKEELERRITAGDKAGADLEAQLADCIERHNRNLDLEKQLKEARAIARQEHARAEKISADILKQVDAQKAIAAELKETIALVGREREALLAELDARPKFDPEEKKRLLAENEKLSRSLKEAWAKAKSQKGLQERLAELIADSKQQEESINKLMPQVKAAQQLKEDHEAAKQKLAEMKKASAANDETTAALQAETSRLQETLAYQKTLKKRIHELTGEKNKAEDAGTSHRAEALRERILRKKLEVELEDAQAQIAKHAAAKAAEKAAAQKLAKQKADALAKLLDIAPIYFGKNQAESEEQEKSLLAQVAEIHKTLPDARFRISGHTCTDGTPEGNLALSQRRAQRVADLLTENGIPKSLLAEVVGKGQTAPRADNSTQQGREANRRVEIEVLP